MKYTYREGVQRQKGWQWIAVPTVVVLCLLYVLFNVFAPIIYYVVEPADGTAQTLVSTKPDSATNRLYIPKINLTVDVVPVEVSEALALEKGAVQRSTASGNPKDGGTYVLTAERFALHVIPHQTYEKSYFYHLGKVTDNDDIYVDYAGERYAYKVVTHQKFSSSTADIEKANSRTQLVLYAAQASGTKGERDVVTARLVGKIIWTSGSPKLQSL